MGRVFIFACLALAVAVVSAHAGTVLVDCQGTGDCETIQEGINAAVAGDTVLVMAGGYFGDLNRNLHFNGKQVVLTSMSGRRATTINADNVDRVFNLVPSDGPDTSISGFTIMNGTQDVGGGIFFNGASITVSDCLITSCTATHSSDGGGGIRCSGGGTPTLIDVTISACRGQYGGGFSSTGGATPTLTRVRFESNMSYQRAAGAYFENPEGVFSITDCVFDNNNCTGNYGGGLYCFNASPLITGTTFVRNRAVNGGHIVLAWDSDPIIENSILAFTAAGQSVHRWNEDQSPTFTRCLVYGNSGGDDLLGVISDTLNRDPRFCGVMSGDVTLCTNSPCLPANNVWTVMMGAEDSGCPDCTVPVEETTWGRVKALWR